MNVNLKWLNSSSAVSILLALSACSQIQPASNGGSSPALAQPQPSPLVSESNGADQASVRLQPKVEIYPGTGGLIGTTISNHRADAIASSSGDITLNFIATDIRDVAKAILGDYLKLNYEIAQNVQGSITVQTSRPLTKQQVLPVLEQALQLNGMALVQTSGMYKVVPLADAKGTSGFIRSREYRMPGYGIEIVPVHYISAEEMQKILQPIAPSQAVIHVDAARNVLLIEGTEQERRIIVDDVSLFDTDWLAGMSYALYTPNYIDSQELTRELNQILGGMNSPITGVVKLIPIDRLNTVLAISPQVKYLEQLKAWVNRLDRPGEGSDRKMFVYQVQNGRATDLAATLSKLMGGSSGSSGAISTTANAIGAVATGNIPGGASGGSTSGNLPSAITNSSSSRGGSITADEINNALVILASPQEYSAIQAALRKLDAPPLQVYIQAVIAEVTLTNNLQFGVQYMYSPGSQHKLTFSDTTSGTIASAFPGFSYAFTRGSNIQAILDTLSSITHVDVTSSPELMVLNNQTANLQVGDRVPIATAQAVGVTTSTSAIVNNIQYQDTGVVLKVTPRVNHGGLVMMDIQQEVSQVTTTTSSSIDSPTIQQRKIQTSVAIQDGQTIALGGLITENRSKGQSGIPFIQQIPILGHLFGDTTDNATRTELMVLITPHVVENTDQANAVTEELRKRLPEVQPLLERLRLEKSKN